MVLIPGLYVLFASLEKPKNLDADAEEAAETPAAPGTQHRLNGAAVPAGEPVHFIK